jgi:hypothetical protein
VPAATLPTLRPTQQHHARRNALSVRASSLTCQKRAQGDNLRLLSFLVFSFFLKKKKNPVFLKNQVADTFDDTQKFYPIAAHFPFADTPFVRVTLGQLALPTSNFANP